MGIFDKLAFWKHEEVSPPKPFGLETGFKDVTGIETQPGFSQDSAGLGDIGKRDFGTPLGSGFGGFQQSNLQGELEQESAVSQPSSFGRLNQARQPDLNTLAKNVEIISSKVDTIRAILDNLTQKIEKIERIAEGEQQEKPQARYSRW